MKQPDTKEATTRPVEKLLGCPFCGAHAHLTYAFPEFERSWLVDCEHDDDCILRMAHGMMACELSAEAAAAAWNRRAPETTD